jgi:hypothetical protein
VAEENPFARPSTDEMVGRLTTMYWAAKDAGDVRSKNTIAEAISMIEDFAVGIEEPDDPDDIVTRLRDTYRNTHMLRQAADEIERLRALCNDLYHDATCDDSFCRLCGEGIREWEAHRG